MKRLILSFKIMLLVGFVIFVGGCGDDSDEKVLSGWAVGVSVDGYGTIIHSKDGGVTWTRQGDALSVPDVNLVTVRAVDSLNVWAVGSNSDGYGTILKTTNGGKTWIRLGGPQDIPDVEINCISVLNKSNAWVVGGNNTILFTDDGGNSWTSKSDPIYDQQTLSAIVAVDANNIWICGDTGTGEGLILHSTDGGDSWTSEGDSTLLYQRGLISISAVNQNNAWTVGSKSTVLSTSDGGNTWEEKSPQSGGLSDCNGVCALDENIAWIVLDYGSIYLTKDNGQTWSHQVSNASGYYLLRICALDENTAWIAGTAQNIPFNGIILHTTDGGQTWNEQHYGLDNGLWDIHFVDSHH